METKTCRICGETKPLADFRSQVRNGRTYYRPDCRADEKAWGREWYRQRLLSPTPVDSSGEKKCVICEQILPLSAFSPLPVARLGVRSECRKCACEKQMAWQDQNPDKVLNVRLRKKFGITLDEYNDMLAEQGGVCAICGNPPVIANYRKTRRQGRQTVPRLVVDHDHVTRKVRGLLCVPCNRGIGFLKDSADIVRFALKYLEERGE